jgi:NAD+ kinase
MVKTQYKFSHISLSTSSKDSRVLPIATQVYEILDNADIAVSFDKSLSNLGQKLKQKIKTESYIVKNSELLIAIGGDGTMLNCSRRYGSKGIPILGINLGKVGFLTDISPEEITSRLLEVIKGEYIEDKRSFLEACIVGNKDKHLALNEIVIHSGAIAQLIDFDLFINEKFVYRQKADGLIVSSPSGSTAYSLSGGGPIVLPSVKAMTLLPMFPHSLLNTSPLIVDDNSKIKIEMIGKKSKAVVSMDSHNSIKIKEGDIINISIGQSSLTLIHPPGHDFYEACRNKLGWSADITKN